MFSMQVQGGQQLARTLDALPAKVSREVLLNALRKGGMPIRDRAAQLAPREPGAPDLADNIQIAAVRQREGQPPTVAIGVSKNFFYDYFQETGTIRHRAQPFYRPAFDELAVPALGTIGRELWAALASARVPQGTSEAFGRPAAPQMFGGPGGGLL